MLEGQINPPEDKSLCIYCDADEIRQLASELASDRAKEYNMENPAPKEEEKDEEDFYDDCLNELQDEYGMCRGCYDEDHADDWDDDY